MDTSPPSQAQSLPLAIGAAGHTPAHLSCTTLRGSAQQNRGEPPHTQVTVKALRDVQSHVWNLGRAKGCWGVEKGGGDTARPQQGLSPPPPPGNRELRVLRERPFQGSRPCPLAQTLGSPGSCQTLRAAGPGPVPPGADRGREEPQLPEARHARPTPPRRADPPPGSRAARGGRSCASLAGSPPLRRRGRCSAEAPRACGTTSPRRTLLPGPR